MNAMNVYKSDPVRVQSKNLERFVLDFPLPPSELRLDAPKLRSLLYCVTSLNTEMPRMIDVYHYPNLRELVITCVISDPEIDGSVLLIIYGIRSYAHTPDYDLSDWSAVIIVVLMLSDYIMQSQFDVWQSCDG